MRMVLHCSGIKALDKPNVFPDRDFCGPFSLFSLCSGYPALCLLRNSKFPDFFSYLLGMEFFFFLKKMCNSPLVGPLFHYIHYTYISFFFYYYIYIYIYIYYYSGIMTVPML